MRFTIDKEQFSKALNAASKAVPTKSANPILPNFCLTLNEKGLEVLGFNGDLNQAIIIRTFISRNNELWFQAGGGIVARSDEEYELQEVNNKLGALRQAIKMAEEM